MSEAPANLVRRIVAAPHRVPEPLRNQAWRAVQAEGLMLFDFAVSRPELKADLDAAFIRLQVKSHRPRPVQKPLQSHRKLPRPRPALHVWSKSSIPDPELQLQIRVSSKHIHQCSHPGCWRRM